MGSSKSEEMATSPNPDEQPDYGFSKAEERKLIRRVDFRLLPILFAVYVVSFLDRVSISNGLTMGLPQDLKLKGNETNTALTIFFIPYILFELPSNILMRRFTPSIWLSTCAMSFGIITLAQGFVTNYQGLLATRFLLGVAEAGVYPGSYYVISFWYKREESQKRFAIYYCSTMLSSAIGGLIASGVTKMDGVGGLRNWRWLFILQALLTIVIAFVAYFTILDFPDQAKWLTEAERNFIKQRNNTTSEKATPVTMKHIGKFFTDPKRLVGAFMYFGTLVPVYSFIYFAPTIIKSLGYSTVQTQLRTVVPYSIALVTCLLFSICSDAIRQRSPFVLAGTVVSFTAIIMLMAQPSFRVQYAALCLFGMGIFPTSVMLMGWYVMNLHGHADRAIGTAWILSFGSTGAIVATFAFREEDAPAYRVGYAICIGAAGVMAVSSFAYWVLIWRARREQRRSGLGRSDEYLL